MVTGFHCSFWHEGCSMEKNIHLAWDAAENVRLKDARPHRHHSARRFCFAADCQLIAEQKNRVERRGAIADSAVILQAATRVEYGICQSVSGSWHRQGTCAAFRVPLDEQDCIH